MWWWLVATTGASERHNVLLLVADDLRPQLNFSFGLPEMHTPALDQLAREGITFTRAYSQQSICAPTRKLVRIVLSDMCF